MRKVNYKSALKVRFLNSFPCNTRKQSFCSHIKRLRRKVSSFIRLNIDATVILYHRFVLLAETEDSISLFGRTHVSSVTKKYAQGVLKR